MERRHLQRGSNPAMLHPAVGTYRMLASDEGTRIFAWCHTHALHCTALHTRAHTQQWSFTSKWCFCTEAIQCTRPLRPCSVDLWSCGRKRGSTRVVLWPKARVLAIQSSTFCRAWRSWGAEKERVEKERLWHQNQHGAQQGDSQGSGVRAPLSVLCFFGRRLPATRACVAVVGYAMRWRVRRRPAAAGHRRHACCPLGGTG